MDICTQGAVELISDYSAYNSSPVVITNMLVWIFRTLIMWVVSPVLQSIIVHSIRPRTMLRDENNYLLDPEIFDILKIAFLIQQSAIPPRLFLVFKLDAGGFFLPRSLVQSLSKTNCSVCPAAYMGLLQCGWWRRRWCFQCLISWNIRNAHWSHGRIYLRFDVVRMHMSLVTYGYILYFLQEAKVVEVRVLTAPWSSRGINSFQYLLWPILFVMIVFPFL